MMNKKYIIICLVLLLVSTLCSCSSALGEDDELTFFSTSLLTIGDYNAKEWMSSESNRALFTVFAVLDYASQEDAPYDINGLLSGSVYIGRHSFLIAVGYNDYIQDESLMILFDTLDNTRAAYKTVPFGKEYLEGAMEYTCNDGYYKVDPVDIRQVLDALSEIIDE